MLRILFLLAVVFCFQAVTARATPIEEDSCTECTSLDSCSPCMGQKYAIGTYTFSLGNGCSVQIRYKKRYCAVSNEYEVVLDTVGVMGSCDTTQMKYLYDIATKTLLTTTGSGFLNFPPHDSTEPPARWTLRRPVCVEYKNGNLSPCSKECCSITLEVSYTCDRRFAKRRKDFSSRCHPTIISGGGAPQQERMCTIICDDDFLRLPLGSP